MGVGGADIPVCLFLFGRQECLPHQISSLLVPFEEHPAVLVQIVADGARP